MSEFNWPKQLKKTHQRQSVISLLEKSEKPLSAREIFAQLSNQKSIWLSTVYRILESFEKEDMIVKTTDFDSSEAIYEIERHRHTHYAICIDCHKRIELTECPIPQSVTPPELGFHIINHRLEVLGYCADCFKNHH